MDFRLFISERTIRALSGKNCTFLKRSALRQSGVLPNEFDVYLFNQKIPGST